jgi:hypothetical protein
MKQFLWFLCISLFAYPCFAKHSDHFLIGAYSQYQLNISYNDADTEVQFGNLGNYLEQAGFNATTFDVSQRTDSTKIDDALKGLNNFNIDAILQDSYWLNNGPVGLNALSYGNYLEMQAEYILKYNGTIFQPDIIDTTFINDDNSNDKMNYVFKHDTGDRIKSSGNYSNNMAWECRYGRDTAGLALYCPRFRWKPDGKANPRFIGSDFKVAHGYFTKPELENRLYLTVALKWDTLSVDTPIADISLEVANQSIGYFADYTPNDTTHPYNYYTLTLHPVSTNYTTSLVRRDLNYGESASHGFRLFEYYADFPTDSSSNPSFANILGDGCFHHINPKIFWHGNTTMYIDYIVLEDRFHRSLRTEVQPTYLTRLQSRLEYIANANVYDNLAYFYTADEPSQGQFHIYHLLQSYMENQNKKIITATNISNDWNVVKPTNATPFFYPGYFASSTIPKRILLDAYALQEGNSIYQWNTGVDGERGIQHDLQTGLLDHYQRLAKFVHSHIDYANTELMFCPQIFGERTSYSNPTDNYWKYLKPPLSLQKCLQLLPLCYGADGILSFAITSDPNYNYGTAVDPYHRYAPLMNNVGNYSALQESPGSSYTMLRDANQKIKVYGPIIKNLSWVDADAIMTDGNHPEVTISNLGLTSLSVNTETNPPHPPSYGGYVQCGYYHDSANNPYFMLVNRRAVYKNNGAPAVVPSNVDDYFTDADPQTVQFTFTSTTVTHYGGNLGLYDPESHNLAVIDVNRIANVNIDAGDASLRQVVAVLPPNVTSTYSLDCDIFAASDISIHNDGVVTIQDTRTLTLMKNTKIYVQNGATLRVLGSLAAGDSTIIYVRSGSTLDLTDAVCQWGLGASIIAENSSIIMNNSQMKEEKESGRWKGISCTDGAISFTNNSFIKGAEIAFDLNNSSLTVISGNIEVPDMGIGIKITGENSNNVIHITGSSTDETLIYSIGTGNCRGELGIDYSSSNHLVIEHTVFQNLYQAIGYISSDVHTDSISACSFEGCNLGMIIEGENGLCSITNCQFISTTSGIETSYYQPDITDCSFTGGNNQFESSSEEYKGIGITLDYVIANTSSRANIQGCTFENLYFGILGRQSSSKIRTCNFHLNNIGIQILSSSFFNCTSSAKNLFENTYGNIGFDIPLFRSGGGAQQISIYSFIQLKWGHNQFYGALGANDFIFPSTFGNIPVNPFTLYPLGCINADGNYWDDGTINTDPNSNFVTAIYVDPNPQQVNYSVFEPDRFDNAVALEDSCLYQSAYEGFRDILSDRLDDEISNWGGCVDRSFQTAIYGNFDLYDLIDYYSAQIEQTPDSLESLKLLIRDYQAKSYIELEDYQSAADLIELALEDPESEVDSLNAVLDLEICYLLASLGESKKPLVTNFTQYRYPDLKTYTKKHREHLMQLLALSNKSDQEVPIPDLVSLKQNYPNPFNPSTTIEFGLPKPTKVSIRIYNIRGQLVKELVNKRCDKGKHKAIWYGKNAFNKQVASGVYFYRLEAAGKCITHKMVLLK